MIFIFLLCISAYSDHVLQLHDFKLARVARDENNQPVEGKVYDYTFEELQHFHLLNSTEKIPTFEAFLNLLHVLQTAS